MLIIHEFQYIKLKLTSRIILTQHMQQCYYMWTERSNVQNVINGALQTPVSRENKYRLLLEYVTVCISLSERFYPQTSLTSSTNNEHQLIKSFLLNSVYITVHDIHLLQIQVHCCESNDTTNSTLQRVNLHLTGKV